MPYLLDANVLIALCDPAHVHSNAATKWAKTMGSFATCPVTEGALMRFILREVPGADFESCRATLMSIKALQNHKFLADSLSYAEIDGSKVVGHKQMTDAYLVSLAKNFGYKLATFDQNLAKLFPEEVELLRAA